MKRIFTMLTGIAVLAALFLLTSTGSVNAQTLPEVKELWEKVKNVNPELSDYSVDLNINVAARYHVLSPKIDLEGTYYYKKPGKHKLQLKRGSYFLNKYPNIFGWNFPDISRFTPTLRKDTLNGKPMYVLTLIPNYKGTDLQKEEFWIDPDNFSTPRHVYEYSRNGKITLDIRYRNEGNYMLYDNLRATFSFPKENLSATAVAKYNTYKTNQGLTDEFFNTK